MDYKIRKMTAADISEVVSLGASRPEFSSASGSFWTAEQLNSWVDSPDDLLLVAANFQGKVLGFSFYAVHKPTGKVTWENLYIDESVRLKGLATTLITEGLRIIKKMGYRYIALQNNSLHQEKFALYLKRFGFKRGGQCLWMDKVVD